MQRLDSPGAIIMGRGHGKWSAVVLNLLVPGAGLVILRREWLGLCLALLYGLLVQSTLWGVWLIPMSIPRGVVVASAMAAASVWVGAQWLLIQRWRLVTAPEVELEIDSLLARADSTLESGDLESVRRILLVARALNDEHVGVNIRWGRVMQRMGRLHHARATWQRVLRLRPSDDEHRQAREALAATAPKLRQDGRA